MPLTVPESVKKEHDGVMSGLDLAVKATGKTGEVARELASELRPHFQKEEELIFPILGMLKDIAEDRLARNPSRRTVELYRRFRDEYFIMLKEHTYIASILKRLRSTAEKEGLEEILGFTETLELHAKLEEEVLYPAAIIAGKLAEIKIH